MDNFNYVQGKTFYTLSGNGISLSDTSVTIDNFTLPDGTNITMSMFGDIGFGTFEPGSPKEENYSFTGVTQNGNGTATLTGLTRGLKFVTPYNADVNLRQGHGGGTSMVLANSAPFYNQLSGRDNDETITGTWTFTNPNYPRIDNATPPPTDDEQFATKKYVDDVAIAGSPKATPSVYGITKLSTAAVSPTDPIAVGDNDTRVPTQGENDALQGTVGTPSDTNRYVTNDDTTSTPTADAVVRGNGSGQVLGGWLGAGTPTLGAAVVGGGTGNPGLYRNKIISLSTTPITIGDTTTETTLATATLTGGTLGTNDGILFSLNVSNLTNRYRSLTFRLKIGSTTIATASINTTGDQEKTYKAVLNGMIFSDNSTSSQAGRIAFIANETQQSTGTGNQSIGSNGIGTATEDTSTNKTITLTGQWGGGSGSSQTITVDQAVLMFF